MTAVRSFIFLVGALLGTAVFGIFVPALLAFVAVPLTADWLIASLPLSPVGKLLRRDIRERCREKAGRN